MKNRREYGIKFKKDENSGIAAIIVFNKTDNMYVTTAGVKQSYYVEQLVDLYSPISGYQVSEKEFIYWIALEDNKEYTITVKRTGTYSSVAPGPYSYLNIVSFMDTEKFVDTQISGTLTTYHTDFETDKFVYDLALYTYPLTDSSISQLATSLAKTQEFVTSASTSLFSLSGTARASRFVAISRDNGENWLYPYDVELVWGSNSPYYNDETIDLNGYFSILFSEAVPTGETVIIKYIPQVNTAWLGHVENQPESSDGSFVDTRAQGRFIDYALEIIPKE